MNLREDAHLVDEPLFNLQLRVARRADQLSRNGPTAPTLNLHCWLMAESEILQIFRERKLESAVAAKATRASVSVPALASGPTVPNS